MRAKFGVLEQTQGLHLPAKFHLNVFIVSASNGQKPQFWTNSDILGGSCIDPLLPMRAKFFCAIADPRSTRTCQISSRSVYSVVLWRRTPPNFCHILPYFGLRHSVMSPVGSSLKKLNTGAQLQTFHYTTVTKSFLYSNAFMAKPGEQSLTFKSATDRQTNRQTDRQKTQRFWPPRRRMKSEPHQKLGTVIEDLEHVLAPLKLLGV